MNREYYNTKDQLVRIISAYSCSSSNLLEKFMIEYNYDNLSQVIDLGHLIEFITNRTNIVLPCDLVFKEN